MEYWRRSVATYLLPAGICCIFCCITSIVRLMSSPEALLGADSTCLICFQLSDAFCALPDTASNRFSISWSSLLYFAISAELPVGVLSRASVRVAFARRKSEAEAF